MNRLVRIAAATLFVGIASSDTRSVAQSVEGSPLPAGQMARLASGTIAGQVVDGAGTPLAQVTVSALGARMAFALTDHGGHFELNALPPGSYLVRAHRSGFAASRSTTVEVQPNGRVAMFPLELRRSGRVVGTAGRTTPRVLRAGLQMGDPLEGRVDVGGATTAGDADPAAVEDVAVGGDDTVETVEAVETQEAPTAWRLKHLKRSVLRDTIDHTDATEGDDAEGENESFFGRTVARPVRIAAMPFADVPLSGQVNFLTSTSFEGPQDLFSYEGIPSGVAYVSVGAPTGAQGEWSVHGALTQGDVASWILAGSYVTDPGSPHLLEMGLSYSAQRYDGANPAALKAVGEGNRNVGAVHASDRWSISRRMLVSYGARYGRYDYLQGAGLFSPHAGLSVSATDRTRIRVALAQDVQAPGAMEFLPPAVPGLWLPPERTFGPLSPGGELTAEQTRHAEFAMEHRFSDRYVVEVRRFYQSIDDQLATVFGAETSGVGSDLGHYAVASAGSTRADGWGVTLTHALSERLQGSVDYALTTAEWISAGEVTALELWAPSAVREGTERFHDVTTAVETQIPETATRLYVVYKVNTAYARREVDVDEPGLAGRFNVQVNQRLPFLQSSGTRWEFLVAVRNLFREPLDQVSVYDELLVVRPPKRIVGGLQVRF